MVEHSINYFLIKNFFRVKWQFSYFSSDTDPLNKIGKHFIRTKMIICGITVKYLVKFIYTGNNNFYITLSIIN